MKRLSVLLILALVLQLGCDKSKLARLLDAVGRIPAVVNLPPPARDALNTLRASLHKFKESGGDARKWIAVLELWEGYLTDHVFKVSPESQERMDGIIGAVNTLLGQVQVPVGIKGSGGGASDLQTERVVVQIEEGAIKRLEELVK